MRTNKEFVSRIVNDLKALSKDGHISRRHILAVGQDKARFLMSQKLDEMTLFKESDLLSNIECFEMCKVRSKDCGIFEFNLCDDVMKSKCKLPEGLFSKKGSGITLVTSVGEPRKVYDEITPREFENLKKRAYVRDTTKYYTVKDGYLYLPDSTNELVEIALFAIKKWEVEGACGCCKKDDCKSYWDYPFVCPDRFYDLVAKDTFNEIASGVRGIVKDTNPNMDENLKTKTAP